MQFSSVCVCVTVFKVLTLFGVFSFIPLVLKQKVFCCLMDSCVLFSRLVRFILFTFLGGGNFCHPKNFFFFGKFFFFFFCILSFIKFCSHLVWVYNVRSGKLCWKQFCLESGSLGWLCTCGRVLCARVHASSCCPKSARNPLLMFPRDLHLPSTCAARGRAHARDDQAAHELRLSLNRATRGS